VGRGLPGRRWVGYARRMAFPAREALGPLLWVFLAGGVGATLRVVLGGLVDARGSARLPHAGTLLVNMLGCLAIGVAAVALPPGTVRTAVVGGLLGGFTTYSAFALFSYELLRDERIGVLVAQIGLHVGLGIACVAAGMAVGRVALGTAGG
jgi:fluoride exporter